MFYDRWWWASSYRGFYGLGSNWSFAGYGASYPFDDFGDDGSLRVEVKPKDAEVFVDGYYAGIVDEFDGHFQHLSLAPGPHRVEIRAPGYEPLAFDVGIQANHKTTYRGLLRRSEP